MYVHIIYMYVHIYIGTYLSSEGSEDPSEINFGPILGQKNWAITKKGVLREMTRGLRVIVFLRA